MLLERRMSKRGGKSRRRGSDEFRVSEDSRGIVYSTRAKENRVARNARVRQIEQRAKKQVRRYPVGWMAGGIAIGVALGGLLAIALMDAALRTRVRERGAFKFWQ